MKIQWMIIATMATFHGVIFQLGMLMAVSAAFIMLTSPAVIANAVWPNSTIPTEIFIAFGAPQNLNHAINGVLYCVDGSCFRNELKKLFKCRRKDSGHMSYTSSSSVKTHRGYGLC